MEEDYSTEEDQPIRKGNSPSSSLPEGLVDVHDGMDDSDWRMLDVTPTSKKEKDGTELKRNKSFERRGGGERERERRSKKDLYGEATEFERGDGEGQKRIHYERESEREMELGGGGRGGGER
eukprot:CAMPEP_0201484052 /NCGR_PEP_ID=MMETSP0151_2-20130828/8241_1 /ASSEMBLY_ACC=CAM_ASM_000257 /TAXON_ID=200890 /ORGANISM="Paramoeba atlantica, Strain 621/1 / CCAP 1560/9" /LENGTH=121 /DNA_ID=CAMNT_0047867505 /DNA_START=54 /DNA_END=416 /DNA_ORIENTATION=-